MDDHEPVPPKHLQEICDLKNRAHLLEDRIDSIEEDLSDLRGHMTTVAGAMAKLIAVVDEAAARVQTPDIILPNRESVREFKKQIKVNDGFH